MRFRQVAGFLSVAWTLVAAEWPKQSYKSENFSSPGFEVSVNDAPQPGSLFFATVGVGYLPTTALITTDLGELIWRGPEAAVHDFRVSSYRNKDVLTYWSGYGDSFGHGYGSLYIVDDTYSTVASVCLKENIVTPDPDAYPGQEENPCYFDSHEAYLTNRGTFVGAAYNVTRADLSAFGGPVDGWIFDALFYEVDVVTQQVLFRWSAYENVPLKKSNYFGDDPDDPLLIGKTRKGSSRELPWDFFHINSIHPVKGGYIVDSRMTWSFYFVNAATGKIRWTLEGSNGGDFELEDGIFWSWQHMPRLQSVRGDIMRISLFNNENINHLVFGYNQSTGYLLKVDTAAMKVSALRDLTDDSDKIFSGAEGSYQALARGHTFMGYGSRPVMKEFDRQGNVVYNVQWAPFSNTGSDQDKGKDVHSYRSYRYPWTATPSDPPKVAAFSHAGAGKTRIYMSWNGATEYDSWAIFGGKKSDELSSVASGVARNGFETLETVRGGLRKYKYVQVQAMKGSTALSTSDVVAVQDTRS